MSQDLTSAEKVLDSDRELLKAAKTKKIIAGLTAEKALAQNETADAQYNLLIAHLFIKYGLTANDQMNEDGSIARKVKE